MATPSPGLASSTPVTQVQAANAATICDLLQHGRETQRGEAELMLRNPNFPVDRKVVRDTLLRLLSDTYKPEPEPKAVEAEKLRSANTRAWLLYILPFIADVDVEAAAVMKRGLDPSTEQNRWCRYWALVGQVRSLLERSSGSLVALASLATPILQSGDDKLVVMLARAAAARAGDATSLETIRTALLDPGSEDQWEVLRAIRIVPLGNGDIINRLCDIVSRGDSSDITYDAIQALTKIGPNSDYVKRATRCLGDFVDRWATYPGRDAMRLRAIAGLGGFRRASEAGILVEQLLDENPAIVREAARALEACVGTRSAVDRILFETAKSGNEASLYASGLRWMEKREEVVDQLALAMMSAPTEQREYARTLLSEVGGVAAMEKLRVQSNLMTQHSEFLKLSEDRVQDMFKTSIEDAHTGFKRSLTMDQVVFYVGILLIVTSASLMFKHDGRLSADWVGTGTTGVLGVLYTLLIAKPRQQVEQGVDHLMKLKVVFLGFLRQLHQADSSYVRRLLDDKSIGADELKSYNALIEEAMQKAGEQLKAN